ncbi:N-acetylneuraminate lyase [Mycoplasma testudineum]|uniref:N-acetylneuraminate lyase n=1 Tax=Mycoplasma testudineum TaxID=244584 RepID=A0A4R6IDM2_9MOLU|nr:N-acetylneuraminate lyase [Mycoplasma testudineum]OYD26836.1 N-acetylneuraminate lyase [Mycoplasma testudineum]TDO20370.1 N-acetylneuraminate lyase [Mycoplasma testudineum]
MSKNLKLKYNGIYPALVTPFDKDGKVNHEKLEKVVEYLISVQKVDGLYVTGSTGEFLLMSAQERIKIFETVAKVTKKRIKLIAQVGVLNVDEAIEMAKAAKKYEFDAISAITPYYYSFSFDEVKEYYSKISSAAKLDMFIYYLPQLAGGKMSVDQFGELLKIDHVVGAKYGAMDIYFFERLIRKNKEKIFFYAWDEALSLGILLGADGAIGSTYTLNAKKAKQIFDKVKSGNIDGLKEMVHEYNDFVDFVVKNGLMQTLKATLTYLGVDAGYSKLPFNNRAESEMKKVAKEIKEKYLN